ncbi:MAG TPA: glycosyl hydrolase family 28-related protein [Clostridia bacterium]|nr:glycosyl hydrolase family 28-related protein [Clostridia bacterium]
MNRMGNCLENGTSVYGKRPHDPLAVYLTPENFPVKADGITDDTDAIQQAINEAQRRSGYGIVFMPEGNYRISKTIYISKGIRLIGYGKKRPVITLEENCPDFQEADPEDKGQANYMVWFTDRLPKPGEPVRDAGAGTFYSAISNIDFVIQDGNPTAVALRTHYAQHSFISHVDIHIGQGKAGMFDVGNEMENVCFFGGEYGIYTTKTSPGWPFMMVDTHFEGQRRAAIRTQEAGLTIVRMTARSVPVVIETDPNLYEKLYMEDSQLEDISDAALIISNEFNTHTQINLRNVHCRNVKRIAKYRESGKIIEGSENIYSIETLIHGNHIDGLKIPAEMKVTCHIKDLDSFPNPPKKDIPQTPGIETWVNLKELGAVGDGEADDTEIIKDIISKHRVIYAPQGFYRVTDTIELRPDTVLIGLNPIATRFILKDNTEGFGGVGAPKALLEAPKGGRNIVMGISLDTAGKNPRAVGCKWMAGADSYMNDVKFLGGHGGMNPEGGYVPSYNATRTADANPEYKWDTQYWSLWVTDGGGGTFKDIWTASPYTAAGLYVSDTSTEGRIYAMSVEHHVRNEVRFKNVSNWKVLALQLEEEVAEGPYCLPLEIQDCRDMVFANLYLFRVIWHTNPYPYAIKTWNCKAVEFLNIHNYTQIKYTFDNTLFDVTTNTQIRPWEIARLYLDGKSCVDGEDVTDTCVCSDATGDIRELADDFEFIDGICADSKGDIYFCDNRWKRIYRWSAGDNSLALLTEIPYKPLALGFDTEDNLLVVVEYSPAKGATIHGELEIYAKPEDSRGTSHGYWYSVNSTTKVIAIDPNNPDTSIESLDRVDIDSVKEVFKALHPANRWRDGHDFLEVSVNKPSKCFVAPDGITIIPVCYDLMRATNLLEAYPNKPFYGVDEYNKKTAIFDVNSKGYLENPRIFAEKGESNVAVDHGDNVYIPDGQVYIYSADGNLLDEIEVPTRPSGVIIAGEDKDTLFIAARSSLYAVSIKQ